MTQIYLDILKESPAGQRNLGGFRCTNLRIHRITMKRLSCFCFFSMSATGRLGRSGSCCCKTGFNTTRSSPDPQAQGPQSGSYPRRVKPDFEENSRVCGVESCLRQDETGIPSHKERGERIVVYTADATTGRATGATALLLLPAQNTCVAFDTGPIAVVIDGPSGRDGTVPLSC